MSDERVEAAKMTAANLRKWAADDDSANGMLGMSTWAALQIADQLEWLAARIAELESYL